MLPLTTLPSDVVVNIAPAKAEAVPNIATTAGRARAVRIRLQNRFSFCDVADIKKDLSSLVVLRPSKYLLTLMLLAFTVSEQYQSTMNERVFLSGRVPDFGLREVPRFFPGVS